MIRRIEGKTTTTSPLPALGLSAYPQPATQSHHRTLTPPNHELATTRTKKPRYTPKPCPPKRAALHTEFSKTGGLKEPNGRQSPLKTMNDHSSEKHFSNVKSTNSNCDNCVTEIHCHPISLWIRVSELSGFLAKTSTHTGDIQKRLAHGRLIVSKTNNPLV